MSEKNNENDTTKKKILLRLSTTLHDEIARWAEDEFRSINGQIEFLLSECIKRRKKAENKTNN